MNVDLEKFIETIWDNINTVDGTLYSGTDHWVSSTYEHTAPINVFTQKPFKDKDDIILSNIRWNYGFESTGWVTAQQVKQRQLQLTKDSFPVYLSHKNVVYNTDHIAGLNYRNAASYIQYNIDCESERDDNIEQLIRRLRCKILHDGCDPAYIMELDRIHFPYWNQFRNKQTYYHTLFHEIAHWSGHRKRLNRKGIRETVDLDSKRYKKEEIIAELASVMLCIHFNVDVGFKTSISYINGYSNYQLTDTREKIVKLCTNAYQIYQYIVNKDCYEE